MNRARAALDKKAETTVLIPCCYNQCRGNPGCYREERRNSKETVTLRKKIAKRRVGLRFTRQSEGIPR